MQLNWTIKGFTMRVFKWHDAFSPLKESPIAPVWIRIEGLPLYMFEEKTLLSISNSIGKPLKVDPRNINRIDLCSAHICVELNVSNPLVDAIWVRFEDEVTKEVKGGFWASVFYDVVPSYCSACHHIGHGVAGCKRKLGLSFNEMQVFDHKVFDHLSQPKSGSAVEVFEDLSQPNVSGHITKDGRKVEATRVWMAKGSKVEVDAAQSLNPRGNTTQVMKVDDASATTQVWMVKGPNGKICLDQNVRGSDTEIYGDLPEEATRGSQVAHLSSSGDEQYVMQNSFSPLMHTEELERGNSSSEKVVESRPCDGSISAGAKLHNGLMSFSLEEGGGGDVGPVFSPVTVAANEVTMVGGADLSMVVDYKFENGAQHVSVPNALVENEENLLVSNVYGSRVSCNKLDGSRVSSQTDSKGEDNARVVGMQQEQQSVGFKTPSKGLSRNRAVQ